MARDEFKPCVEQIKLHAQAAVMATVESIPDAEFDDEPDLCVLIASRPGAFSHADVERIRYAAPLARIVDCSARGAKEKHVPGIPGRPCRASIGIVGRIGFRPNLHFWLRADAVRSRCHSLRRKKNGYYTRGTRDEPAMSSRHP